MSYLSTVNDLVAGSVAGAAQVLVGQPLDTVKTRAQVAPSQLTVHNQISILTRKQQRECLYVTACMNSEVDLLPSA